MAFNLPALLGSLATFPGFVLFGCFQLVCFQCWTWWVNLLSLFFMPESMFSVLRDASCVWNGIYTVLLDWVLWPSFWASGLKTNGSLFPAKLTWWWCAGKPAVWGGKTQIWSLLISVVAILPPQLISSRRCDGRDVLTCTTNSWELVGAGSLSPLLAPNWGVDINFWNPEAFVHFHRLSSFIPSIPTLLDILGQLNLLYRWGYWNP